MAPNIIPSCCLTAEQKDALIEAVQERPVIWDCSLPEYQDVQNRRTAFAEVAEILSDGKNHYTGPEMQVEWKKLRDIFNRTLKKVVASGGGDSEVTWRFWQRLQFIADHERSQIFKAMQKWSKKVLPASSSPATKKRTAGSAAAGPSYPRRIKLETRRFSPSTPVASSSCSMVQQLADVAHSARELLGMDSEEMVKEEPEQPAEQQQAADTTDSARLDPLSQILLLSSQMQQQSSDELSDGPSSSSTFSDFAKTECDLPKLLSDLLAKGAATETENRRKLPGAKRARLDGDSGGEVRGIGSDQFDIFGMFIASQVRTMHSQSPQTALRLKRALTELCFKFEAEMEDGEMNGHRAD